MIKKRREVDYGHNEYMYKIMMARPQTELSKDIGRKWYLTLEKLAEESGLSISVIFRAVEGDKIGKDSESKIRAVLNNL